MIEKVTSEKFIDDLVKETLGMNSKANIAIIGPSTLDRDHSTLFFSDLLSGTKANMLIIDLPQGEQKDCYGSINTLKEQMYRLRKKYPYLKKPVYIENDVYYLDKRLDSESIDIIYDHDSLLSIISEGLDNMEFNEASNKVIKMYSKLINKKGKIIIMSGYFKFEQELPTFWQTSIFDSFRKNNLSFETYFIDKDIDLRKKFPELNRMRGREKNAENRIVRGIAGPQYLCGTMAVARKNIKYSNKKNF